MCCRDRWIFLRRKTMSKRCPVCGAEIMAGQEVCTNCLVYLWEVI